MVGDRIADMLTRIRNANQMRYETRFNYRRRPIGLFLCFMNNIY